MRNGPMLRASDTPANRSRVRTKRNAAGRGADHARSHRDHASASSTKCCVPPNAPERQSTARAPDRSLYRSRSARFPRPPPRVCSPIPAALPRDRETHSVSCSKSAHDVPSKIGIPPDRRDERAARVASCAQPCHRDELTLLDDRLPRATLYRRQGQDPRAAVPGRIVRVAAWRTPPHRALATRSRPMFRRAHAPLAAPPARGLSQKLPATTNAYRPSSPVVMPAVQPRSSRIRPQLARGMV